MVRLDHSNICDKVYDILSEQIINQKLKPGERLPEEQLAADLGVSRTPVRDAISRLVKDGFAETEPRKGAFVKDFQIEDVIEIYHLRVVLEGLAVTLAGANVDGPDLKKLKKRFASKNTKKLLKADTELHSYIIDRCGNSKLIEILNNLHSLVDVFRASGYTSSKRSAKATAGHIEIINALIKGNVAGAEKAMKKHIEKTKSEIVKKFKQAQKP